MIQFSPDYQTVVIDATGIDLHKAKALYAHLSSAPAAVQTAEWNNLLRKNRDSGCINVEEAERMQLMTSDICLSTIFLLFMNITTFGIVAIVNKDICISVKILGVSIFYLVAMLIVMKLISCNRADLFLSLVIKNDVQNYQDNQNYTEPKKSYKKNMNKEVKPLE